MNKTAILLAAGILFAACTKNQKYVCVCTYKDTGELSYGDTLVPNMFTKKVTEKSCEANNDVFSDDMEGCHLQGI